MRTKNLNTTTNQPIVDNVASEFVSASTGIDFGAIAAGSGPASGGAPVLRSEAFISADLGLRKSACGSVVPSQAGCGKGYWDLAV